MITRANRHIILTVLLVVMVLLTTGFLTSCSADDGAGFNTPKQQEIGFKADVWKMMEGTRAATFDSPSDLQTEAHFTCVAYEAGTLTAYIPTTTVDWDAEDTRWEFNVGDSHYYWPLPSTPGGAYPSLDFFGYMPSAANLSTEAPYIGSINYTAAHNVTFTCSRLPMTNAGQGSLKEFVFGMALAKNYGNASSGVPLQFQHPFARVKLQLSESQAKAITINTITFKSIKNNGSYDYSSGWTTTGDATNFVVTLNQAYSVTGSVQDIGVPYIMIPQGWGGDIEVVATWNDWGAELTHKVTASVPTTWAAGYSYTYSFTITATDLIVNTTKYTEQW